MTARTLRYTGCRPPRQPQGILFHIFLNPFAIGMRALLTQPTHARRGDRKQKIDEKPPRSRPLYRFSACEHQTGRRQGAPRMRAHRLS